MLTLCSQRLKFMKYFGIILKSGFLVLFFCVTIVYGQNDRSVHLKSGNYTPLHNVEEVISDPQVLPEELVNGHYYRLISFNSIPTSAIKENLKQSGIELLQYIPYYTFYASISKNADLNSLLPAGVISITHVKPVFKLSAKLSQKNYPYWAVSGNNISINAVYYDDIPDKVISDALGNIRASIDMMNDAKIVRFTIAIDQLDLLYTLPYFYYFEEIDAPEEPEGVLARTDHRSNTLATDYATGLKYDGTGITVMLQDNSILNDHIDYIGRVTNDGTASQSGDHGEHTGGIIAAAGNKDPKGKGMAFGVDLLVYGSSNNNYNSVPTLYGSGNLTITSKSYGDGNNAGYTTLTRQLDQQVRTMPSLIHVFSAGNSGASDFGYGAGPGWGNITGGHKQGKNVIAVGNLSSTDALSSSSSRGPAYDGRIKPDICAVGTSVYSTLEPNTYQNMTGTSMACPGVAGSLAQLYQAYKTINGGSNPNSGLMKAAILNTAKDLGNAGPDYKYGWGRINARRAYELISNNNYLNSTISQGGNNSHNINVPVGTKQLRVMVYWTDYEAAASASIALINDINMQVVDPNSTTYDPWVLDETPNASTLDDPAVRGVDNLNNMEQVTIDNPFAGSYSINVNGFSIPQGPQSYYVVYEFVKDEVVVTYPIGGEGFNPGESQTLRWDSNNDQITSTFLLEYSTNNGVSWNTIVSGVPGTLRNYNWTVPSVLTGEAKFRVTQGANSDESDDVFSIIGTPTNLNVAWACPDSLNLTWNPVVGATGYEVYLLGAKYMGSVGTTSATNYTVAVPSTVTSWLSVRSLGPTNAKGERAIAIEKTPGTFACVSGVESVSSQNNITLYPNPAHNQLIIKGIDKEQTANITIYNAIGEKILTSSNQQLTPETIINIDQLTKGIYLLKITYNSNILTGRFIKQ